MSLILSIPSGTDIQRSGVISSKVNNSARPEHNLLRHAIDAAEIAAIRDADTQVVVDPAKGVDQGGHTSWYRTASAVRVMVVAKPLQLAVYRLLNRFTSLGRFWLATRALRVTGGDSMT